MKTWIFFLNAVLCFAGILAVSNCDQTFSSQGSSDETSAAFHAAEMISAVDSACGFFSGESIIHLPMVVPIKKELHPFCSGCLVGSEWVMTAAHCTKGLNFANIKCTFAVSESETFEIPIDPDRAQSWISPKYKVNMDNPWNDFALIHLSQAVPNNIRPLWVSGRMPQNDEKLTVSGIGATDCPLLRHGEGGSDTGAMKTLSDIPYSETKSLELSTRPEEHMIDVWACDGDSGSVFRTDDREALAVTASEYPRATSKYGEATSVALVSDHWLDIPEPIRAQLNTAKKQSSN